MKKIKWLVAFLILSLVIGVIGCKDPEVEHQHKFTKKWEIDEYYHWKKCNCGEIDFESEHSFGDWQVITAATEEAEGKQERKCTVCPYTATEAIEKLAHTHKFAEVWTKDETNHWHASTCGHTTEVSGKAAHSFGEYVSNNDATTEKDGTKTRECNICGYKDTVTDKGSKIHVHTFAESLTKDETHHWYAATCEHTTEVSGKAKHSFGDWTVTKASTEEAEGSRERSCTVCGYTATEAIEKLAHTHKFAESLTKDETHHWYASTCEHTTEVSGKVAHSFGEYVSNNDATTEVDGTKTRECSVCGYKDTVTDEGSKIHVHTFAESLTKDETHHWYAATCEHTTEVSEKAAHSFGEYVSNNDATTEADGTKTRECSVCGYKDTVTDEGSKIIVPKGFVFVKGGTVTGAAYTNNFEGVFIEGRTVNLSDFYMGKYEVTQAEYASVMAGQKVTVNGTDYALESNPSYCTADSTFWTLFNGDVQEKRPVEGVTWYDAVWYCNALSEKEGLTKAYNIEVTQVTQVEQVEQESVKTGYYINSANVTLNRNANGYRLPTEAEWEYAARGGDPTKEDWNYVFSGAETTVGVSYGSDKNAGLDSVGWYWYNNINGTTGDKAPLSGNQGHGTHQVGKKTPNRLGLYDMSGNAGEWCYDFYGTITTTTPTDGAASGSNRTLCAVAHNYRVCFTNSQSTAVVVGTTIRITALFLTNF